MSIIHPLVSVIVPSYGRPDKLLNCINSIESSNYPNLEIIVVDDPYSDGYASDRIPKNKSISVVKNPSPKFVSGSRNKGAMVSKGEYLFFLDSDNIIEINTISALVKIISDPKIGVAAPLPFYASEPDRIWKTGEFRTKFLRINRAYSKDNASQSNPFDVEIIANAFMIRKEIFIAARGFDEVNFPRDEGEPDLEKRLRELGYRTVIVPFAKTYHDIQVSKLAHFSPDRLEVGFKSRFWYEKKHDRRNTLGLSIGVIVLILYYSFLILVDKDFKAFSDIQSKIVAMIRGCKQGMFSNPQVSQDPKEDHN